MARDLGKGQKHALPEGTPDAPPEAWLVARRMALAALSPIDRFLHVQAASGIVLLVCALIALVWANSAWHDSYHALWHTELFVGIGGFELRRDLHWFINDGLMVIFFFVVGLEIRREMHDGELSEIRRAALPVAAAIGGMVVPAGIYFALNRGGAGVVEGWGVPMATDIAFAVGILAILGDRVPAALRVLLLALAIIDDIGAILVIAVFYSSGVELFGLLLAASGMALTLAWQRVGVRAPIAYVPPAVVVWWGMVQSGIHPTIAGVMVGLMTPVRSWFGREGFLHIATQTLEHIRRPGAHSDDDLVPQLERLGAVRREAVPPATRLNIMLHPWVAFGVMPLFALSNAGVSLGDIALGTQTGVMVFAGIVVGLALGKPLGIAGAGLIAIRLGLASFPRGVGGRGLWVVGLVAGIGFTMSLFIAGLAFPPGSPMLGTAKLAILVGSMVAGVGGLALGRLLLAERPEEGIARTAHEAESSTEL
jgi:Na+:H+ antiporter, NhaA family